MVKNPVEACARQEAAADAKGILCKSEEPGTARSRPRAAGLPLFCQAVRRGQGSAVTLIYFRQAPLSASASSVVLPG